MLTREKTNSNNQIITKRRPSPLQRNVLSILASLTIHNEGAVTLRTIRTLLVEKMSYPIYVSRLQGSCLRMKDSGLIKLTHISGDKLAIELTSIGKVIAARLVEEEEDLNRASQKDRQTPSTQLSYLFFDRGLLRKHLRIFICRFRAFLPASQYVQAALCSPPAAAPALPADPEPYDRRSECSPAPATPFPPPARSPQNYSIYYLLSVLYQEICTTPASADCRRIADRLAP